MIVVMEPDASDAAIESVISFLVAAGFDVHRSSGQSRTILGVVGDVSANDVSVVSEFDAVAQVTRVSEPFRLASRRFRQRATVVEGAWGSIGGERPWIAIEPVGPLGSARKRALGDDDAPPSAELPYAVAAGAALRRSGHALAFGVRQRGLSGLLVDAPAAAAAGFSRAFRGAATELGCQLLDWRGRA